MNTLTKRILFGLACAGLVGIIYVSLFGLPVATPEPPPPPPVAAVPVPAPEPVPVVVEPVPAITQEDVRPDCPDCLALERSLLELGYLNQFLNMLQSVRENALRLPPGYSDAIVSMVEEQHPLLAPLVPQIFDPPADPTRPAAVRASAAPGGDYPEEAIATRARAAVSSPSIEDVRVVFARPATAERTPRAHIRVHEMRTIMTPEQPVHVGDMVLELVDVLPARDGAADRRSRVLIRERNSGQTHTLEWL